MKNYCDGGEAILEALRNLGINYIISSPGSEWGSVWEALVRQKVSNTPGPTYLNCWHETLAVDMAIGYTQVTGKPQAVLLHAGPGLMQGSMGVHAAAQLELPMILMSGESVTYGEQPGFDPGLQWYRSLSIVGGPHRLLEPLVKWAQQVPGPHTLYESVVRATEIAQRQPQGPVYLDVPIETMLHEWTPPRSLRTVPPAPKTQPQPQDIERVAALLVDAKMPVIQTDSAGRDPDSFAALVELAELLAVPVVEGGLCSYANFPRDNPLYLGGNFRPFRDETDLVLLVRSRIPWYPPSNSPPHATIVAISETPLKTYMVYQSLDADIYLEGETAAALRLLADAVRARGFDAEAVAARRAHWAAEHDKLINELRAAEDKVADGELIDPLTLCAALREVIPQDAIYVDETVTHRPVVGRHLTLNQPQSYFYVNGGLGQGLGVALGVKLAAPERPVVLLIGDGSFLYNPVVQSLGASKNIDLPILVIVFNNRKYVAMQHNHTGYYPDGVAAQSGIYYGVEIDGPDYAELGHPFGFKGWRVNTAEGLRGALQHALDEVRGGKTAILNVELRR